MQMKMMTMSNNFNMVDGDTTLTKVFVGGLAWETPKEAMKQHFDKYGEILEAVIISDKVTGRSKGYGFVTFKEAESAKKACEDGTPIINGRRANCNLASLGARRSRPPSSVTPPPPPQQGGGGRGNVVASAANQVQWYYPAPQAAVAPGPPSPFHHHQPAPLPFYGYSPAYNKVSYSGGGYMNGHVYQPMMPMYPYYLNHYHHHHHQSHTAMYSPTAAAPITAYPPILVSKPASFPPPTGIHIGAAGVMAKCN